MSRIGLCIGSYWSSKTSFCSFLSSLHFEIYFIANGRILCKKITFIVLNIVYSGLIYYNLFQTLILRELIGIMAKSSGILPTPRSPAIKNGVPASYVKSSYYPIPYQAIIVTESCDIHEILSWDINVSSKLVKIKVEWSLSKNSNGINAPIPKAVYNSIAAYNLGNPTWSSSYSMDKLSLKVEWKINDPSSNTTPSTAPTTTTPHHLTPGQPSSTSPIYDSGYGSPNSSFRSPFQQFAPTPIKLFPPSPVKTPKHDVYRNKPPHQPNIASHPTTQVTDLPPSPFQPSNTPKDQLHENPPPAATLPNINTSKSLPVKKSPGPSKPTKKKKNKNVKFLDNQPDSSNTSPSTTPPTLPTDPSLVEIIKSPNIIVISESSSPGNIKTELDNTVPEFDPQNESFRSQPDPLPIDSAGRLDSTIRADRMKIPGKCRLCHKDLYSFQVDAHLLECKSLRQIDLDDFTHEHADISKNTYADIITIILNYCEGIMHDEEVSCLYSNVSLLRKLFDDLETLLDRKATKIFNKSGMHGQQSRFNILNYST